MCNNYTEVHNITEHTDADPLWGPVNGDTVIGTYTLEAPGIFIVSVAWKGEHKKENCLWDFLWNKNLVTNKGDRLGKICESGLVNVLLCPPNSMLWMGGYFQSQLTHQTMSHRNICIYHQVLLENKNPYDVFDRNDPMIGDAISQIPLLRADPGSSAVIKAYMAHFEGIKFVHRTVFTVRHVINHNPTCPASNKNLDPLPAKKPILDLGFMAGWTPALEPEVAVPMPDIEGTIERKTFPKKEPTSSTPFTSMTSSTQQPPPLPMSPEMIQQQRASLKPVSLPPTSSSSQETLQPWPRGSANRKAAERERLQRETQVTAQQKEQEKKDLHEEQEQEEHRKRQQAQEDDKKRLKEEDERQRQREQEERSQQQQEQSNARPDFEGNEKKNLKRERDFIESDLVDADFDDLDTGKTADDDAASDDEPSVEEKLLLETCKRRGSEIVVKFFSIMNSEDADLASFRDEVMELRKTIPLESTHADTFIDLLPGVLNGILNHIHLAFDKEKVMDQTRANTHLKICTHIICRPGDSSFDGGVSSGNAFRVVVPFCDVVDAFGAAMSITLPGLQNRLRLATNKTLCAADLLTINPTRRAASDPLCWRWMRGTCYDIFDIAKGSNKHHHIQAIELDAPRLGRVSERFQFCNVLASVWGERIQSFITALHQTTHYRMSRVKFGMEPPDWPTTKQETMPVVVSGLLLNFIIE